MMISSGHNVNAAASGWFGAFSVLSMNLPIRRTFPSVTMLGMM